MHCADQVSGFDIGHADIVPCGLVWIWCLLCVDPSRAMRAYPLSRRLGRRGEVTRRVGPTAAGYADASASRFSKCCGDLHSASDRGDARPCMVPSAWPSGKHVQHDSDISYPLKVDSRSRSCAMTAGRLPPVPHHSAGRTMWKSDWRCGFWIGTRGSLSRPPIHGQTSPTPVPVTSAGHQQSSKDRGP